MAQTDVQTASDAARASLASVRSAAGHRRASGVDLFSLGRRFGRDGSWLSRALRGMIPLTRGEVKRLRQMIDELAGPPR